MIIESDLLDSFRELLMNQEVNKKYSNINGKNKWNILCSAADWIDIGSYGINNFNYKKSPFFSYENTLEFMQLISCADLIVQSINQICCVVLNKIPSQRDSLIFKESIPDDKYFAQLRATFLAHPVNLKSNNGVHSDADERWYASWSTSSSLKNNSIQTFLYSNKSNEYELEIEVDLIIEYILFKYNMLRNINEFISDSTFQDNTRSKIWTKK